MQFNAGFVQVLEFWKSPGILLFCFPVLESPGKLIQVLEKSLNFTKAKNCSIFLCKSLKWILFYYVLRNLFQKILASQYQTHKIRNFCKKLQVYNYVHMSWNFTFCPWRVLEKSLNFVLKNLYEPWPLQAVSLCAFNTAVNV